MRAYLVTCLVALVLYISGTEGQNNADCSLVACGYRPWSCNSNENYEKPFGECCHKCVLNSASGGSVLATAPTCTIGGRTYNQGDVVSCHRGTHKLVCSAGQLNWVQVSGCQQPRCSMPTIDQQTCCLQCPQQQVPPWMLG